MFAHARKESPRRGNLSRPPTSAWPVAAALLASVLAAGAAQAQDLNSRVNRLQQELQTLQRAVYGGKSGAGAGAELGRPQAARLELRLSQIETEMRSLTGQAEELAFKINGLDRRLEAFMAEVKQRLTRLEQGGLAPGMAAEQGGMAGESGAETERRPSLGALLQTQPQAQGGQQTSTFDRGPKVIGSVPAADVEAVRQGAGAQGQGAAAPQIASTSQTGTQQATARPFAAQQFATPQAQYDHAFGLLSQANYPAAEQALQGFLERYPQDPLAGNAKYWLGETYYVRGQYREAAVTFAEGYQTYPSSAKAPDNLLKLGKSLSALGQTEDACGTLGELLSRYGDAAANILQQAKRERQRLACQ